MLKYLIFLFIACAPSTLAVKVSVLPDYGSGSGFVVSWAGHDHLLTAGHVCERAYAANAMMSLSFLSGDGVATGGLYKVKRISDKADLCELSALVPAPHGLRSLQLAWYDPEAGAPLTIMGAPYGYYPVTSEGAYISRVFINGNVFLSGSAPTVGPGNSGSPVLDRHGRVAGLLVMGGAFIFEAVPYEQIATFLAGG